MVRPDLPSDTSRSNSLHHIPLNAMRNNGPETIQYDGEC